MNSAGSVMRTSKQVWLSMRRRTGKRIYESIRKAKSKPGQDFVKITCNAAEGWGMEKRFKAANIRCQRRQKANGEFDLQVTHTGFSIRDATNWEAKDWVITDCLTGICKKSLEISARMKLLRFAHREFF
jgi:hypothetical protein